MMRRGARAAGRDTAIINTLSLAGFGWLPRTGGQQLTAELGSYGDLVVSYLPEQWPGSLAGLFDRGQLDALGTLVEAERARPRGDCRFAASSCAPWLRRRAASPQRG